MANSYLWQIAVKELETIKNFRTRTSIAVMEDYIPANGKSRWKKREEALYRSFLEDDAGIFLLNLVAYYQKRGYGDFAFYPFFRWDNALIPIKRPDLVKFHSLIGYEKQKSKLCRNTDVYKRQLQCVIGTAAPLLSGLINWLPATGVWFFPCFICPVLSLLPWFCLLT